MVAVMMMKNVHTIAVTAQLPQFDRQYNGWSVELIQFNLRIKLRKLGCNRDKNCRGDRISSQQAEDRLALAFFGFHGP